jgi:NADPH:quinone reductase
MKAIQVQSTGGPDVLQLRDVPDPIPHSGEALVHVHTSGVNYMDVYYREGKYGSAQEFGKVGNSRGLERFTFLRLFASWPILRNDALR